MCNCASTLFRLSFEKYSNFNWKVSFHLRYVKESKKEREKREKKKTTSPYLEEERILTHMSECVSLVGFFACLTSISVVARWMTVVVVRRRKMPMGFLVQLPPSFLPPVDFFFPCCPSPSLPLEGSPF